MMQKWIAYSIEYASNNSSHLYWCVHEDGNIRINVDSHCPYNPATEGKPDHIEIRRRSL
jgi:hypothetical protein